MVSFRPLKKALRKGAIPPAFTASSSPWARMTCSRVSSGVTTARSFLAAPFRHSLRSTV